MTCRRALATLAVALALPLPGCGWEPLYADPQSGPASADLRAIQVLPISERIGQQLEIALRDSLNPTGEAAPYRYTLRTTLSYSLSDLGIQTQGTATLARVDVTSSSVLVENRTGQNLLTISVHEQNSFELNPNQYSTVVGQRDAQIRTVTELNQEIVRRLTLFMERRVAERSAAPG